MIDAKTDEERFIVLSGAIAGAWMAHQSGASAEKSLQAVWDVLQELLNGVTDGEGQEQ